jgi:hypothetical protein
MGFHYKTICHSYLDFLNAEMSSGTTPSERNWKSVNEVIHNVIIINEALCSLVKNGEGSFRVQIQTKDSPICVFLSRVAASTLDPTQVSMWLKALNQYICEFRLSKPTHCSGTSAPVDLIY